jgi:hypothetical protein
MGEQFELPVDFKGKELQFPAELLPFGFSYRIKVTIAETDFFFEPDEEKKYRAIIADTDRDKTIRIDWELLQAIAETLHELFAD